MSPPQPSLRRYGDNAVLVEWDVTGFDAVVSEQVHALAAELRKEVFFTEIMPGYDSLVASFDLASIDEVAIHQRVGRAIAELSAFDAELSGRLVDIPVHYGGENGPDLEALSKATGKSPKEIIAFHSSREYRVCMMGFIPGFTFLSEVDPALHHPRHATPRAMVPAGSVGIANWQTGIYGLESPGGWQIIGRTDSVMFDPNRDEPFLVSAGDRIRFVPQ
ncbi:MAG: 5-oxoprolinase subunit PxpB [Pseudomonadota bacterium]